MMSAEANKALVRRWFAELDRKNWGIIEELIPEDYMDYNPALGGLPSGRLGVQRYVELLSAAFPDAVHTIEEQIAHGDRVLTRLTARGTFQGEILGFQPTGNVIEISGITVHRIVNGQLVEHWAHLDMDSFMEQLGAPAQAPQAVEP